MGVSRRERDSGKEKVEQQRNSLEKKKRSKSLFYLRVGSLDYVCKLRERRDLSYNLIRLFS